MSNPTATEVVVTSCPAHGVRVTSDLPSARAYGIVARACMSGDHVCHGTLGLDCWVCCDEMEVCA